MRIGLLAGTAASLIIGMTKVALAADCDPRNFYSVDYDKLSSYERLVLLSTSSDDKVKEMQTRNKGEMTVPFIDMPIKGDTSYGKKESSQLKRLLSIDQTSEAETTIIRSRLEGAGAEAYRACIGTSQPWMTVAPADLYAEEATIVLNWRGEQGKEGDIQDIRVSNGSIEGDYKKKIVSDGASLISIKRKDLFKQTTVTVLLNSYSARITLPAQVPYRIETKLDKFPGKAVTSSWHHNGYPDMEKSTEYNAPAGWEILLGSAKVVDEVRVNNPTPCAATNDTSSAKVTCRSASPRKGLGVSAEASGRVILVRAVPINK